ncbi:DUF3298 and DUF4163 domain-containing protein [Paenibacillus lutrae]|uniref:DUF3298 domain-containing protein n=1 Tax=Paenibacillus lutrae TaxID=2078573 RepID=A0A7X3FKZ3_9BACL|nr:DUF3298 and DUF4163 domain-containing protein [Paenibacillus lutrae]MVP01664.1 DUF3298 domain-containing protein [Paenibacillus lutrae]
MALFELPVHIQSESVSSPGVTIYYPRVTGLKPVRVQNQINQKITGIVTSLAQEQKKYQTGTFKEMIGHYELKNNQRGLLSFIASNYAYSSPMAHGYTVADSLSLDVITGKEYSLADLFKPGSDYVEVLSKHVAEQIRQRQIPLLDKFDSIWPDQSYYLADKSLVLYFRLYEITPYYVGFPMFPISVYDLQNIAAPDGPLEKLAADLA